MTIGQCQRSNSGRYQLSAYYWCICNYKAVCCIVLCCFGLFSVRTRSIMAFEQCSSSVNSTVSELVKKVITPRFTERRGSAQMLVKTPTDLRSVQSRPSGPHFFHLCFIQTTSVIPYQPEVLYI